MDNEPKKVEIEEEAILMEMEEAERQEIDDGVELEEDEITSNIEEDDEDGYFEDFVEPGPKKRVELEYTDEEYTDEDEDEDEFRKICNTKNWCGRA
jgi:hypothetical protein